MFIQQSVLVFHYKHVIVLKGRRYFKLKQSIKYAHSSFDQRQFNFRQFQLIFLQLSQETISRNDVHQKYKDAIYLNLLKYFIVLLLCQTMVPFLNKNE